MPGANRARAACDGASLIAMIGSSMRGLSCLVLAATAACKGPPARLIAGTSDTVIVNNRRPVQLPMRVLDAGGRALERTGVRYRWISGMPVSVSATGVTKCTRAGDATVRASLGALASNVLVRCRPVSNVRSLRMMNLIVGGPAQELPFEAIGVDSQPVTLLTGRIAVEDSTIVALDGQRVRALAPGSTGLTMRIGDRTAFASVHTYERASTLEGIRPGQHIAVPIRLAGGEMRRWRIPASPYNYFLAILPDRDEQSMPRFTIVGASCSAGMDAHSFFCLAQHDGSVIVYHPQQIDSTKVLSGSLGVWLQDH
ncbi:MAG: hypothetical protein ABR582_05465 [Gemmatimonadaceae bacterium]